MAIRNYYRGAQLLTTLVLSFPVGLGLGHTVQVANATSCDDDEYEAWDLELIEVVEEGSPDPALAEVDWPTTAVISARESDEGWFHDGPDKSLRLATKGAP